MFSSPQFPSGGHRGIRKITRHPKETGVLLMATSSCPEWPSMAELLWKPARKHECSLDTTVCRKTDILRKQRHWTVSICEGVSVTYGRGCDTKPGRVLWVDHRNFKHVTWAALDVLK